LLKQISGSLEEAHRQGIVHRDLKPENVILVQRAGVKDVVKLLDFGIAARTESADAAKEAKLTQQGMVLGTPPYMSPEQFTGKALDMRSDIYSLAVMAYEMLTGQLPFDAQTPWQWATEHMTSQPRPFETMEISHKIPQVMREAILRALAKDREERFATVTDFVDALDKADPQRSVVPGLDAHVDTGNATAAMNAVPDFGGGGALPAPTAAMPVALPTPPGVATAVAVSPPRETTGAKGGKGGGKGLVYGLVGAAVLLGGGIAVALSGAEDDGTDVASSIFPIDTGPPAASIAPVDPEPNDPTDEAETDEEPPASPDKPSNGTVKPPTTPPKTVNTGKPPTTPTPPKDPSPPKATTPPVTPPVPTTAPNPADACQKCSALANGSVLSAVSQFHACSDSGLKDACSRRAKAAAPAQAQREVKAGNCAKASQIRAAAGSMNAGSPRLDSVVSACK
jgi:serine/threonine-protein kinase